MTATAVAPATIPAAPRRKPIVVALGSTALLGPGGRAEADIRRRNVATAVKAIADLAADHDDRRAHRGQPPSLSRPGVGARLAALSRGRSAAPRDRA
jgi:hypothetical protein